MADYTMTVYELQQNNFDFGLNDYAIFDEEYRPILNNAILEFYKFREIGFQNPYMWRDRLRQRMDLIMRNKYNALYELKKVEFNPLYNVEMKETYTHELENKAQGKTNGKEDSTNTNTNNSKNNTLSLSSTFPSEEMTEDDLTKNLFVDTANKGKSDSEITDSGTGTITSENKTETTGTITETYTRFTEGSSAGLPFSKAMLQFKDYLDRFQLDQQVIDELKDLFMLVW